MELKTKIERAKLLLIADSDYRCENVKKKVLKPVETEKKN
jgi:hypothetical protein